MRSRYSLLYRSTHSACCAPGTRYATCRSPRRTRSASEWRNTAGGTPRVDTRPHLGHSDGHHRDVGRAQLRRWQGTQQRRRDVGVATVRKEQQHHRRHSHWRRSARPHVSLALRDYGSDTPVGFFKVTWVACGGQKQVPSVGERQVFHVSEWITANRSLAVTPLWRRASFRAWKCGRTLYSLAFPAFTSSPPHALPRHPLPLAPAHLTTRERGSSQCVLCLCFVFPPSLRGGAEC